jgi:hypothetical protein
METVLNLVQHYVTINGISQMMTQQDLELPCTAQQRDPMQQQVSAQRAFSREFSVDETPSVAVRT